MGILTWDGCPVLVTSSSVEANVQRVVVDGEVEAPQVVRGPH